MTKKLKAIQVQQTLLQRGVRLFSTLEFMRLFSVSRVAATFFLFHHCQSGLFVRLKNGLFALAAHFPAEEEIANRLYQPSYLSLEYVLARHGILPEAVYTVTSVTTKPSREFEVDGKHYQYHTIKKQAYAGYRMEKKGTGSILMASPEKALVDYLYFVHLKKRVGNERLNFSGISKKKALYYARFFGRLHFTKMVEGVL